MAITTSLIFAQPAKDIKNAQKALNKFFLNDGKDDAVLNEALTLLNAAFESDEIKSTAASWITRGEIYNEVANNEFKSKTLNPEYKLKVADAAIQAYEAFRKASGLAEKKSEKKSALDGLLETESHLNNFAIYAYQAQDFNEAYNNFSNSLTASEDIKALGGETRLDAVENGYQDQLFFTAVSGYYGDKKSESKPLFEKLFEMGSSEAVVYEALYKINSDEGNENAITYLEAGREKFPDDTGMLFTEINHYLTAGNLEALISKLEVAIEKEPDNVTVYTTMGSVYDQLQSQARESGDAVKEKEYFSQAEKYYKQAMEIDDQNFDAIYSTGALYYNKAATYVEILNELAADFSAAGMKKYDAKKLEMDELFNTSLPYFHQAEAVKKDDPNTIIALKEIYARLNQMEKSNEYKARYDALSKG